VGEIVKALPTTEPPEYI